MAYASTATPPSPDGKVPDFAISAIASPTDVISLARSGPVCSSKSFQNRRSSSALQTTARSCWPWFDRVSSSPPPPACGQRPRPARSCSSELKGSQDSPNKKRKSSCSAVDSQHVGAQQLDQISRARVGHRAPHRAAWPPTHPASTACPQQPTRRGLHGLPPPRPPGHAVRFRRGPRSGASGGPTAGPSGWDGPATLPDSSVRSAEYSSRSSTVADISPARWASA